jgi:exopolysaccharide production protein ExoZ
LLRSIQLLRGFAATAVVFHHYYDPLNDLGAARHGAAGVDIFFVISGFIMATVAGNRSWDEFLTDRVCRIYPLWFVAVLPWFFLQPNGLGVILTSITLWPVWGHVDKPALVVGWTLSYEMLFYVVFALGLAMRRPLVPFLIFGGLIVLELIFRNVPLLSFIGSPMALEFLAGVLLAKVPARPRLGAALMVAGLLGLALSPSTFFETMYGTPVFARVESWGVPAVMIVYGALSLEPLLDLPGLAFPLLLGDASYSIYLFHLLLVHRLSGWLVGMVAALLFGTLVHLTIEKPILRAMRNFRRSRAQTVQTVPS